MTVLVSTAGQKKVQIVTVLAGTVVAAFLTHTQKASLRFEEAARL